ncbi:MAG TPA: YncE family protein [Polyangia bacterium]|nr:YncE family protein [Polyangia bacterium]
MSRASLDFGGKAACVPTRMVWVPALLLMSAAGCHPKNAGDLAVDPAGAPARSGKPVRWAVSSNDNKNVLDKKGVVVVAPNARPDTVSIIDLSTSPPRLIHELPVPGSVIGPPYSVAITPDESLALVSSPMKVNPDDPTKTIPDARITVIDLTLHPPRVTATVHGGKQPSGIAISRDGKLVLVANRAEGTVSVFTIDNQTLTAHGTVAVSDPAKPDQKPQSGGVAISPDGKLALVTNDADHRITVLKIEGTTVSRGRDFYAGIRPYGVDIASNGKFAIVGNVGNSAGDIDTISLVDLEAKVPRVVDTLPVGITPEGVKIAPDCTIAVAVVQNASNKAPDFPFYSDHGKLVVVRIEGKTLRRAAEAPTGGWPQGAAFTSDGRQILVGSMIARDVEIFSWNGNNLADTGWRIPVGGGSAAIRTADR